MLEVILPALSFLPVSDLIISSRGVKCTSQSKTHFIHNLLIGLSFYLLLTYYIISEHPRFFLKVDSSEDPVYLPISPAKAPSPSFQVPVELRILHAALTKS